jgi:hypothetical protein
VHEPGAVHRLDHAPDRLVVDRNAARQPAQPVAVRRHLKPIDQLPLIEITQTSIRLRLKSKPT